MNMVRLPAEKEMSLKSRRLTIGLGCLSSTNRSITKEITEMTEKVSMNEELNQSSDCPLSSTICSAPRPTMSRPSPQ